MDLSETYIFRIVHIDNLSYILDNGSITGYNHDSTDSDYIGIGEKDLIEKRSEHVVNVIPHNQSICPCCEYIPFYFAPRSVMLYRIQKGYKVEKIMPDKIIYIIFKLDKIIKKIDYLFTDGHGYAQITRWFDDIAYLSELDKHDILTKNWKNTEEDQDKQRRKQAEFWIRHEINIGLAEGIAVYSKSAEAKVTELITKSNLSLQVKIKPTYYYD